MARNNDKKNAHYGEDKKYDGRRSSKNRRGSKRKDASRDDRPVDRGSFPAAAGQNDVTWYAANENLLRDTASFPYSYSIGTPISIRDYYDISTKVDAVPGVMAFDVVNTPGRSVDGSSPINIAAKNIYSYVRHANSGHSNYESNDMMIYFMCMDSLYSIIAHAKRAYGVARTYSQVNRYYPDAVLTAMGFDPDNVRENLAQLRYTINAMIVKAGSLAIPNSMPLFKRHAEQLYSYLYTDTISGPKCQTYLFRPANVYIYRPVKYETGGAAEAIRFPYANPDQDNDLITVAELYETMNEMINALIKDEDINIMSGDIIKAFGADNLLKLAGVEEDYVVMPVFNPEIMTQINNMSIFNIQASEESFDLPDIKQDGVGNIVYDAFYDPIEDAPLSRLLENHRWIVNMPIENPTPADTMVATRLIAHAEPFYNTGEDGVTFMRMSAYGSEIVSMANLYVFQFDVQTGERTMWVDRFQSHYFIGYTLPGGLLLAQKLMRLSAFDNHPRLYISGITGAFPDTEQPYPLGCTFGDINTYTLLDSSSLERMHTAALLSELDVPAMGVWSRK